jgi:predicted nucleic acid-binding protein
MRTTVALDDDLLRTAQEFTGVAESGIVSGSPQSSQRARKRSSIGVPGRHDAGIEEYSASRGEEKLILADTSVWIDHVRSGNKEMRRRLDQGQIVIHPFLIAELALGSLQQRTQTLAMLDLLGQVRVAQLSELCLMMEARRLYNLGIGLTDAQVIASVLINPPTLLWTKDKQLPKVAEALRVHVPLP